MSLAVAAALVVLESSLGYRSFIAAEFVEFVHGANLLAPPDPSSYDTAHPCREAFINGVVGGILWGALIGGSVLAGSLGPCDDSSGTLYMTISSSYFSESSRSAASSLSSSLESDASSSGMLVMGPVA